MMANPNIKAYDFWVRFGLVWRMGVGMERFVGMFFEAQDARNKRMLNEWFKGLVREVM